MPGSLVAAAQRQLAPAARLTSQPDHAARAQRTAPRSSAMEWSERPTPLSPLDATRRQLVAAGPGSQQGTAVAGSGGHIQGGMNDRDQGAFGRVASCSFLRTTAPQRERGGFGRVLAACGGHAARLGPGAGGEGHLGQEQPRRAERFRPSPIMKGGAGDVANVTGTTPARC